MDNKIQEIKISDLKINKKYLITNAEFIGKRVQMTVVENDKKFKFFLPKRFDKTDECDLNSYLYHNIVYEGKKDRIHFTLNSIYDF